jgi:VWFA-related protein
MKHLIICNLFKFLLLCLTFSQVFAQSDEIQRPKLKNFGSSLKKKKIKESKIDEAEIKVITDFVVNDVLVLDEKGSDIKGLSKEDFIVTDNGEAQDIEVFALGNDAKIPRSIVLLIDHSASEIPFIVNSVMSAKILVDNLRPNDKMAIVTDNVELLCDFTRDKEFLKNKLESLKSRLILRNNGQSRQYSALTATVNELFNPEDTRRIVIFQTDGDQVNLKSKPFDFEKMTLAVEKSRSIIYSVFPGLRFEGLSEREKYKQAITEIRATNERLRDKINFNLMSIPPEPKQNDVIYYYEKRAKQQSVLRVLAESTGGRIEYLETPMMANQIYSKILEGINKRYIIGYYPKNETKDGKRRTVKIEVRNHPEYQIEGRKTYFPVEAEN